MKRFIVAAAVAVLAAPAAAQTTLTFGGSDAIGTILDRGNAMFTKLVNERAAGKLKVNFIQGEQLGSDVQVIEQTMQGSVHVYGDVLDWYANWVKDYAILAWGFTFRDAEHMQKFLDSPTYAAMAEKLRKEQGLRILAAAPTQPRILFSKKPVGSLNDLNGVKMRVPEIKTYLTLWETLGTRPSRAGLGRDLPRPQDRRGRGGRRPDLVGVRRQVPRGGAQRDPHRPPDVVGAHHDQREGLHRAAADMQKLVTDCAVEAVQNTRKTAQTETEDVVRKMAAEGAKVTPIDKAPIQAARQGRRGQDGEGRRLVAGPVGPDPEAVGRHAGRATSACSTASRIAVERVARHRADPAASSSPSRSRCSRATRSAGRSPGSRNRPPTPSSGWSSSAPALGLKQGRHILHRHLRRAPAARAGRRRCARWSGCWCCSTLVVLVVQGVEGDGRRGRASRRSRCRSSCRAAGSIRCRSRCRRRRWR